MIDFAAGELGGGSTLSGCRNLLTSAYEQYAHHQKYFDANRIYYDDWRDVDGIKFPHIITHNFPKRTMTLTVKGVKSNVPVDTKILEKSKLGLTRCSGRG